MIANRFAPDKANAVWRKSSATPTGRGTFEPVQRWCCTHGLLARYVQPRLALTQNCSRHDHKEFCEATLQKAERGLQKSYRRNNKRKNHELRIHN